jgi:fido (protein-threonine AMPylation protein)
VVGGQNYILTLKLEKSIFHIVVIYAFVGFHYMLPAAGTSAIGMRLGLAVLALAVLALIHKFLYVELYWWAFYHRKKFLRGPA